ncbi:MAG: hypothetical protein EAY75_14985, partial [Bacteroidetes bacterium]
NFGDRLVNYSSGMVAPVIAGFSIYQHIVSPSYTVATKAKVAFAAVPGAGTAPASVAFVTSNVAKKTGLTKQYFMPAAQDPEGQSNKMNYRHYYIALPMQNRQIGAMVSALS